MQEQSYPTLKLDSTTVVRSKWANRHDQSFADEDFLKLKSEIYSSGGNVQPIKVRPLLGKKDKFEIVFGHRRHQACFELNLPVLAIVQDLDDRDLFSQMDRENRSRKDLRPYEQGVMYAMALEAGLFPSARRLAEDLDVDAGSVGRLLAIARLPDGVLAAFPSPLDIQVKWSTDLVSALQEDRDAVLERAKSFQKMNPRPDAKTVLAGLVGAGGRTILPLRHGLVTINGRAGEVASFNQNESKKTASLNVTGISAAKANMLRQVVADFLVSKSTDENGAHKTLS